MGSRQRLQLEVDPARVPQLRVDVARRVHGDLRLWAFLRYGGLRDRRMGGQQHLLLGEVRPLKRRGVRRREWLDRDQDGAL